MDWAYRIVLVVCLLVVLYFYLEAIKYRDKCKELQRQLSELDGG